MSEIDWLKIKKIESLLLFQKIRVNTEIALIKIANSADNNRALLIFIPTTRVMSDLFFGTDGLTSSRTVSSPIRVRLSRNM